MKRKENWLFLSLQISNNLVKVSTFISLCFNLGACKILSVFNRGIGQSGGVVAHLGLRD